VHSSIADKFLTQLKANIDTYYENGEKKNTLGKVINSFHHERCCKLLADHGGTVICGNANADQDKNLVPTVVLNPILSSPLMQEEIFGPILPVFTYRTIQEAIDFVNKIDKPLAVYYFGKNSSSNRSL
jgi:acyl-CoA reductase-like NAD-dependent aldehyde dehydrogenase